MRSVAGLIKDDFGKFQMGDFRRAAAFGVHHSILIHRDTGPHQAAPAVNSFNQRSQCRAALAANRLGLHTKSRTFDKADSVRPRHLLDFLLRLVPKPPLGRVHDPLESKIVIRADHNPEIGHRIADLHPLVKARATDHTVR